ncbi:MAG: MFS transporter [Planctomycetales bacterium]|nr:MFS transporter [Planctomycetales bacterium]
MPDTLPENKPDAPLPWTVKLLGLTSLLNDTASEMLAPVMPAFLTTVLHAAKWQIGLIDGLGETVSSLVKLWSGARSDNVGRRKGFILVGYFIAVLTRPLMGLAASPWHIFGLRTIDRVGKGIRTAPRDAMIADTTNEQTRGRAFGFHRAMDHLGAALGALIAVAFLWWSSGGVATDGAQEEWQLRRLFMLSLIPGIPILFLVPLALRETPKSSEAHPKERFSLQPLDANFRRYLVTLLLFTLGNSSDSFLLVRAKELGVPIYALPILWIFFHLAKSGGNLLTGGWVNRLGARPLIWAGWLWYAAVYLAFGFANSAWQIWVLFMLYAVFYALTEPAEKALVATLVGPERKGLAYGWFNLTVGIGSLPASLLFGFIYDQAGPLAAFGTGAAFALAASVMLATVRVTKTSNLSGDV